MPSYVRHRWSFAWPAAMLVAAIISVACTSTEAPTATPTDEPQGRPTGGPAATFTQPGATAAPASTPTETETPSPSPSPGPKATATTKPGAAPTPVPPGEGGSLPTCTYVDLTTTYHAYSDWARTLLDTIYRLPSSYAPSDLASTSKAGLTSGFSVRALVIDDLTAMAADAKAAGATLAIESAYRSYSVQVSTFQHWVDTVGRDEALLASARPGHSEHQLGTAIDFKSYGGSAPWNSADWATTKAGAWLAANAWQYGWVMSYPKAASPALTCYQYEPWHYRYVGRATAVAIHDSGLAARQWFWEHGSI